jgi:Mn2+/Fe2+ NRAMP family transporter
VLLCIVRDFPADARVLEYSVVNGLQKSSYTAFIVLGAAIILLPIKSLLDAMLASQTLNGVLLPVILIAMLKLINNKRLMGKYVNGRAMNVLAWITVIILISLTVILVITNFFPGLIGG